MPSTGKLKAFKLLSTSNAYWKGDARNQPMQRVYGTAFLSDKDLKAHLTQIEEAKKRDHRKLGRELGLFTFHQWAPGAAFWLDKGTTLYNTLANYMRDVLFPAGYVEVKTPLIFNKALWETSGPLVALPPEHVPDRRPIGPAGEAERDDERQGDELSRPHARCSRSEAHSYRDLPLRFHEQTPLHRNEASGVLSGLTRVRQFSQDDAHCFVTQDQIGDEVERLLRLVQRVYGDFGLPYTAKLVDAAGGVPRRDRHVGSAEAQLKAALEARGDGLYDQRRRRRVLRAEDRLRRDRRDRPQVAVRDDSARLPACRSAST